MIALTGMAFKGQPETSDLRGSSSVYIAKKLKAAGFELRLHDFVAYTEEMEALDLGRVCENLKETCRGVRLLLVLNNHKKYSTVMRENLCDGIPEFEVLDTWNACTELHFSEDIRISTLGNMFQKKESTKQDGGRHR